MQTTNTSLNALIENLRSMVETYEHLEHADSKAELSAEADWLYANALELGATPAQIAAAVPGIAVFA